ncbi:MAG: hypothetical protein K5777_06230 [Nitrosopumilus sp.]|nr:hypothetical protein [Nitrosopumilus sp.]
MKGGKTLAVIGIIIVILGSIFHLQGQSIVGPEKSFMYSNPDWVTYGIVIVITGIVILSAGLAVIRKS